jgi:predicted metalloprotease with PDZ domain
VVAGAFFTNGWFTSTRGDHGRATSAKEISQQMNLRQQGFEQDGTNSQAPSSQQGYLGIGVATVTPALQEQYGLSSASGALVTSVDDTGPAFQAGFRRGDIITSIDGTTVATRADVINLVANKNVGDSVSVVIDRDGQSLTFQVTLAARPATIS